MTDFDTESISQNIMCFVVYFLLYGCEGGV
jgi:hypothetical protein